MYIRNKDLAYNYLSKNTAILEDCSKNGAIHLLDKYSTFIWKKLSKKRSLNQLIDLFSNEFNEYSRREIKDAVSSIIPIMLKKNIICIVKNG